jgi:hypothetical protein
MKKNFFLAWLAAVPLCFCGCEQFTDSIRSQTAYPVRVKVAFTDGVVIDHLGIWGTNYPTSGIIFRWPVRIESLEAFDSTGRKIGGFSRNEVPHDRREYGRNVAYVIFDDGIFPVPNSAQSGLPFVSEDLVKSVFKKEAGQ